MCIYSTRDSDVILFTHEGGVDIGDVDAKANKMVVEVEKEDEVDAAAVTNRLLGGLPAGKRARTAEFIVGLYKTYVNLYFTYLEVNPLVITKDSIYILDLAAKA